MAGHDGSTAWRTNPAGYREAMEVSTLLGQPVDIGRLEVRMPVTAQISPTPIIGKDENDIGTLALKKGEAACKSKGEEELCHHDCGGLDR